MTMNKKVMVASLFVACLMVASLGALLPTYSNGEEPVHYKEINTKLDFNDDEEESWASNVDIINKAAGDTVCSFTSTDTENILTFSKSVNLKCINANVDYFMGFRSLEGDKVNVIELGKDVEVNLMSGEQYPDDHVSEGHVCVIFAIGEFKVRGEGTLIVDLHDYNKDIRTAGALIYFASGETPLVIDKVKVELKTEEHTALGCISISEPDETPSVHIQVIDGGLLATGKYAVACDADTEITIKNSTMKLKGTEHVLAATGGSITSDCQLYGSNDNRGINIEKYDSAKLFDYRYISTKSTEPSSLALPLLAVFAIACVLLFGFVFFFKEQPAYMAEAIAAKKAAEKAEKAKQKEEAKKAAEAKKAEEAKIKAEQKAKEAQQKEEAKKVAEAKKAEEARIKSEQKAAEALAKAEALKVAEAKKTEEARLKAEQKATEAQTKEDAKKAAEAQKAEEARLKSEQKAAEAKKAEEAKKAAEAKKVADKKAKEEKKAAEKKAKQAKKAEKAKQKEEAKKAKQAKKAEKARQKEEAKKAKEAQKAAEKKAKEEKKAAGKK